MTIKDFSHKHSVVLFWTAIVLAIILLATTIYGQGGRRHMMRGEYNDGNKMMNKGYDKNHNGNQKQMMDPNNPNQPLINDTPNGAAGIYQEGVQPSPDAPVMSQ